MSIRRALLYTLAFLLAMSVGTVYGVIAAHFLLQWLRPLQTALQGVSPALVGS